MPAICCRCPSICLSWPARLAGMEPRAAPELAGFCSSRAAKSGSIPLGCSAASGCGCEASGCAGVASATGAIWTAVAVRQAESAQDQLRVQAHSDWRELPSHLRFDALQKAFWQQSLAVSDICSAFKSTRCPAFGPVFHSRKRSTGSVSDEPRSRVRSFASVHDPLDPGTISLGLGRRGFGRCWRDAVVGLDKIVAGVILQLNQVSSIKNPPKRAEKFSAAANSGRL